MSFPTLQKLSSDKICSFFLTLSSLFQLRGHIPDTCFRNLILNYNRRRKFVHKNSSYGIDLSAAVPDVSEFEMQMFLLEDIPWHASPKLYAAEYDFLMNLNFATNRPNFVKEIGNAVLSFYVIENCDTFSKVCHRCVEKFHPRFLNRTVERQKIITGNEAEGFFKDSESWCAECITQTLFFLL